MAYYPFIGPNQEVFFMHLAEPAQDHYVIKPVIIDGPLTAPVNHGLNEMYKRVEHEYDGETIVQYVSMGEKKGYFTLCAAVQEEALEYLSVLLAQYRREYFETAHYQPNKMIVHPGMLMTILGDPKIAMSGGYNTTALGMEVYADIHHRENAIWMAFERGLGDGKRYPPVLERMEG